MATSVRLCHLLTIPSTKAWARTTPRSCISDALSRRASWPTIRLDGATRSLAVSIHAEAESTSGSTGVVTEADESASTVAADQAVESVSSEGASVEEADDSVPLPVVVIDQLSEPGATVLELKFGDRLGALLDTASALTDLGLSVVRAKVTTTDSMGRNRFVLTQADGGKIENPDTLETIRLTVIANLLQYHPESSDQLALAAVKSRVGRPEVAVNTQKLPNIETIVRVENVPAESHSVLTIETADRPGLILEIVRELGDLSINVVSAEIDTEGPVAKDQFYVSYHGEPLNSSMQEVLTNTLRFYLTRYDIESEESY